MSQWKMVGRPGYLGKERDERYAQWDRAYGVGVWRLVWKFGEVVTDFTGACAIYEDAYHCFLERNLRIRRRLIKEARDIYDDAPSNVDSCLDYTKQETARTHVQDIAIRRSLVRMGLRFQGSNLIQIRDKLGDHPLSLVLSPGRVPFHRCDLIEQPELQGWWRPASVEAFYQSNRYLQVKAK